MMENNNHKKIAEQIEKNMKQAFYDLIDQNTNSENPDFDWIVNLYVEIKEKLMHYLKKENENLESRLFPTYHYTPILLHKMNIMWNLTTIPSVEMKEQ